MNTYSQNLWNFKDKKVLITGASKGLGWVCAQELALQGARLVCAGRNKEKLAELKSSFSNPENHMIFAGDLVDPKIINELILKSKKFLGEIEIVLHVLGGGYGFRDPLLTWEQLDTLHKVNIGVAAEINRQVVPEMIKNKSGYVVHVGSISSQEATASVGYNTVKASLAAYVRSLGRELASSGVVVTGVLPGAFYAPGNSWRRLEEHKPEVVRKFTQDNLPRKKIAEAEEIVPLILFLASEAASMMSGSCVPIDAGEGKAYVS
jgi:3-oxoacyl-[acyl-carrier protein] reductase